MIAGHLIVLATGSGVRKVPLVGAITIGSGPECTVRLADASIEPRHAVIEPGPNGWLLVRVAGTLHVNGRRARRHELADWDLVTLGRSSITFRATPLVEPASRPPAESIAGSGHALAVLRRLYHLTRRLAGGDAPEALRTQLLDDVVALSGADRGLLVSFDGEEFRVTDETIAAHGGFDAGERAASRTVLARMLETKQALLWTDPTVDADLAHAPSIRDTGVRSLMCAPIHERDELVGALYLSRSGAGRPFDEASLDLLTVYANQAALVFAAARERLALEGRAVRAEVQLSEVRASSIIGSSPPVQALLRDLHRTARTDIPVLLLGETGTGKELLAREVHRASPRAERPFIAVNCGAIPAQLLESELFGHVRGAFTDAREARLGRIRAAHQGTLFLDEIGEMALPQQASLLRVLEDRVVQPVGGDAGHEVDFRLVCATNQDLDQLVASGRFRRDLFFRIAGVTLQIPALRARGDDVIELARFFLHRHRATLARPEAQLSAAALTALRTHSFPGNVRELEAVVRRAVLLSETDLIEPASLGLSGGEGAAREAVSDEPLRPLEQARDEFLKRYVLRAVELHGGNRTAAARALDVTPRTIFKYLDEV